MIMKKIIVFLFVITVIFISSSEENIIIPRDSLRFRIIANSNSYQDQLLKMEIRTELLPILSDISNNSSTIEEARKNVKNNINNIQNRISKYSSNFNVNFGQNYFPHKKYNNVIYNAGNYESLVITLGEGIGDNWWCVLFPPLCLLEAEISNLDSITYDSYLKKIINKYL
ncbi:MAG: stage II sporulation protein R [Firmicutes bacterium]|nr:stage II sporulation protein R [Bacillota bacterium]